MDQLHNQFWDNAEAMSATRLRSALTSLEARVRLVDDVDAALATNQTVFAVTGLQRLERILDLHFPDPQVSGNENSPGIF
jgi:hypothetical protein